MKFKSFKETKSYQDLTEAAGDRVLSLEEISAPFTEKAIKEREEILKKYFEEYKKVVEKNFLGKSIIIKALQGEPGKSLGINTPAPDHYFKICQIEEIKRVRIAPLSSPFSFSVNGYLDCRVIVTDKNGIQYIINKDKKDGFGNKANSGYGKEYEPKK